MIRVDPILFVLILCLGLTSSTMAQEQSGSRPSESNHSSFRLPPPSPQRTPSGIPGPDYWQQQADYRIDVTLDPSIHRVEGTAIITYTNNAPQPLRNLWLHLDQNFFADSSRGMTLQGAENGARLAGEGGMNLTRVELIRDGLRSPATYKLYGTRMQIMLSSPLSPGSSSLQIEVDYSFVVPEYGAARTGYLDVAKGTVYQIALWYPRMAVFDDLRGWNTLPYLGQGEFYREYGSFDVSISAPNDFIIVATGELQNESEVYTQEQLQRLDEARLSDESIPLVRRNEVGDQDSRPGNHEYLTWHFRAVDVNDFAWAASQAFIVDAASWEGVLLLAAYPEEGLGNRNHPGWESAIGQMKQSLQHYSASWVRYPYPVAHAVAGIVQGADNSMLSFGPTQARNEELTAILDHELSHAWFPQLIGSNERRDAWMDEGFATFLNFHARRGYGNVQSLEAMGLTPHLISETMQMLRAGRVSVDAADHIPTDQYGFLAYRKPAYGLILLREYILGPEQFEAAFRAYIDQWAYKHPAPSDFFRIIDEMTGEDLSWFWEGWFMDTTVLDQTIMSVESEDEATTISIVHLGELLLPAEMEIRFADQSSERLRIPVEAFFKQDTFSFTLPRTDVVAVHLDPDQLLPDIDRSNNRWIDD